MVKDNTMRIRFPLLICCILAFFMTMAYLKADARPGLGNRRADVVENKRVEKQLWTQPQSSSMMNKRFPIEQWDKHFSSVGSKRAPIQMRDRDDKPIFKTNRIDRKEVDFEMSRWNERMASLHDRAGIAMDDRAQLVADQQMYNMMLQQGTQQFSEMASELSLRDLNRFQFRRNRPDGAIPVDQAGAGR
jgi:hypothetical protein